MMCIRIQDDEEVCRFDLGPFVSSFVFVVVGVVFAAVVFFLWSHSGSDWSLLVDGAQVQGTPVRRSFFVSNQR